MVLSATARVVLPAVTLVLATVPTLQAQEAATVVADHIRQQGYACRTVESANRDAAASKPDEAVWILKCDGATYRVRLVPDRAAVVEPVK